MHRGEALLHLYAGSNKKVSVFCNVVGQRCSGIYFYMARRGQSNLSWQVSPSSVFPESPFTSWYNLAAPPNQCCHHVGCLYFGSSLKEAGITELNKVMNIFRSRLKILIASIHCLTTLLLHQVKVKHRCVSRGEFFLWIPISKFCSFLGVPNHFLLQLMHK